MAISPPSDLVMDVVRAADPSEVQEAQARLKANRAAFKATSLVENGNGFANTVAVLNQSEGFLRSRQHQQPRRAAEDPRDLPQV